MLVLAGWQRSYHHNEIFCWAKSNQSEQSSTWLQVHCANGLVTIYRSHLAIQGTIPPERVSAALPWGTGFRWIVTAQRPSPFSVSHSLWNELGFDSDCMVDSTKVSDDGEGITARHELRKVMFPFAIAALSLAILPMSYMGMLLRWLNRKRRQARGLCETCGYDLRHSQERCPECGTRIGQQTHPRKKPSRVLAIAKTTAFVCSVTVAIGWLLGAAPGRERPNAPTWWSMQGESNDTTKEQWLLLNSNKWFLTNSMPATSVEARAFTVRRAPFDPSSWITIWPAILPKIYASPVYPSQIPTMDRGVTLRMERVAGAEGEFVINVRLKGSDGLLSSEFEHHPRVMRERRHVELPVLFYLEVDGHSLVSYGQGEVLCRRAINSVKAGDDQVWQIRIGESSLKRFLPDYRPHTLSVFAAFSECRHVSSPRWPFTPRSSPAERPVLVRSAPVHFRWTGTAWEN